MRNAVRHVLVYAVVITVIATVWVLGSARATYDRAEMGYYPSAEPELFKRAMNSSDDEPKAGAGPVASVDVTK